jgi:hypothetical protein
MSHYVIQTNNLIGRELISKSMSFVVVETINNKVSL